MRSYRGGEYYSKYTKNGQAPGSFAKFLKKKWDCCLIHYAWFSESKWCGRKKKSNFNGHGKEYEE